MRPVLHIHPVLLACLLPLIPSASLAQRSKSGPALSWQHELAVLPNTLKYQDSTYQAFTFTVFETNAKDLMELWRADHQAKSTSITKGDPVVANGVRIDKLSADPIKVIAQSKADKKAGTAAMTIAFRTDTASRLAPLDAQETIVRDMAVRYNQAIVEHQISEEEKAMGRSSGKLAKSTSKDEKLNKKYQKANADLNKVVAKRMKEQTRNARLQGDMIGAEHAYTLSKDVKDLKKMTKAREKLSTGESKVAKLMEQEVKIRSTATKYSSDLSGSARAKEEDSILVDSHQKRLEALRTKLRDIR